MAKKNSIDSIDLAEVLRKSKSFAKTYSDLQAIKKLDRSLKELVSNSVPVKEIINFYSSEFDVELNQGILTSYIEENYKVKEKPVKNKAAKNKNSDENTNDEEKNNESENVEIHTGHNDGLEHNPENKKEENNTFFEEQGGQYVG